MRKSRGKEQKVTRKNAREPRGEGKLTLSWPMEELLCEVNGQIESFSAQVGMRIMHAVIKHEVGRSSESGDGRSAYRHGSQPGYVAYGSRKVSIARPRVRGRNGGAVGLDTYRAFQGDYKMQSSVARQLTRWCSTRDYAFPIDECLDGYGEGGARAVARSNREQHRGQVSSGRSDGTGTGSRSAHVVRHRRFEGSAKGDP